MIKGKNIPKPATINQKSIDSCFVTLLKYGIKYFVKQNIKNEAGI